MKENLLYSESIAHAKPSWRRRLMLVLMVALPLFLQAQTITFSKNKVSIGTAIENIRQQTNYSINFASDRHSHRSSRGSDGLGNRGGNNGFKVIPGLSKRTRQGGNAGITRTTVRKTHHR